MPTIARGRPSLLASIDIGSNSVRLLIGRVGNDKRVEDIYRARAVTRLAKGVAETGILSEESMNKTISALKEFSEKARGLGASRIKAVGTSALREAENAGDFIRRILNETGIEVEVVSGEREAELTASGVLSGMDVAGPALIIDIGGGSTEWIYSMDKTLMAKGSAPFGAVKLHERHIRSDPPSASDILSLDEELEDAVSEICRGIDGAIEGNAVFIETAGTATTLAAIDLSLESYDRSKAHMHRMTLSRLRELSAFLTGLTLEEREKMRGLEPSRADLIIPGIHFTIKLMEKFGFDWVLISDSGLLDGALIELAGADTSAIGEVRY